MPIKPPPARGSRIDWSRIVLDLINEGMSAADISAECGYEDQAAGKAWVQRLKNIPGTQPKFHHGAMLLGLWATTRDRAPAMAPMEP